MAGKYIGSICARHPEREGLRYHPSGNCVGCTTERRVGERYKKRAKALGIKKIKTEHSDMVLILKALVGSVMQRTDRGNVYAISELNAAEKRAGEFLARIEADTK